MKIFWSHLAVDRLEEIYEFIAEENVAAAQKAVNSIFKKVESLVEYPERGRKVPEVNRKEIREVFETEHRIIYRLESHRIIILTIRSFKQLLPDQEIE